MKKYFRNIKTKIQNWTPFQKRYIPIFLLPQIIKPIAVTTKAGPALTQKQMSLFAVCKEISFLCKASAKSFAPIGYPPIKLKKIKYPTLSGNLKIYFVIGCKHNETSLATGNRLSKLQTTIKGKSDGKTTSPQRESALETPSQTT